jgi:phosphate transport system protein
MLHDALDAFARMDANVGLKILREDSNVDSEYESISRQLITYMMEDARSIPSALNIMWAARALERIAAHSSNICEHLIYLVKGKDIRHTSLDQIEQNKML